MAEVVARVLPNPPPLEIANLLLQVAPQCFFELGGRDIAKRAASELKELKAEAANLADRLAAFPKRAEAAISVAMLWNHQISSPMYDITEPLNGGQPLVQEIEKLWIRLRQFHDAIPPDVETVSISKPGRTPETQIDEFLEALKSVWKKQTNLEPDTPRHRGFTDKFAGDFLDFAWAAVTLARQFPNSDKLGLPNSPNALGERLARKKRARSPKT